MIWTLTNKLRWSLTGHYNSNSYEYEKVLQQLSVSETGEQRWDEIEIVDPKLNERL